MIKDLEEQNEAKSRLIDKLMNDLRSWYLANPTVAPAKNQYQNQHSLEPSSKSQSQNQSQARKLNLNFKRSLDEQTKLKEKLKNIFESEEEYSTSVGLPKTAIYPVKDNTKFTITSKTPK